MNTYEELKARGLIAQVTDEERISDLINKGEAVFYIGFDPTADSLHVGHFMALCLMKRLQMAGNKPIALIGGGTAMIGDPSGKTDMRKMMTLGTRSALIIRDSSLVTLTCRPGNWMGSMPWASSARVSSSKQSGSVSLKMRVASMARGLSM